MPVVNYIWDVASDNVLMEMDDEGNILARYVCVPIPESLESNWLTSLSHLADTMRRHPFAA